MTCTTSTYTTQDGPEFMAEDAKLFNYPFPYLYDEVRLELFSFSSFSFVVSLLKHAYMVSVIHKEFRRARDILDFI